MRMSSVVIVTASLLAGCEPARSVTSSRMPEVKPDAPTNLDEILRVGVAANGEISAEGQPITLERLAAKMAELKKNNGVVWYYRENMEGVAHPNAVKVIELVTRLRLPIR